METEDKRVIPTGWRGYLSEMKESIHVYAWVWRELISGQSKRWARPAMLGLLGLTLVSALMPWFFKGTIDGLIAKDLDKVVWAMVGVLACKLLPELFHWLHAHWREYCLGDNQGRVDLRTTELFFKKSLGQHLRDTGALNAANIEKGRNRSLEVEQMMLFEGVPVVFELVIPWLFLWWISPLAGFVMTLLFLKYVLWMFYLNRKTVEACTPLDAEFRKLNRYRVERLENIERVKTCGKEEEEVRTMDAWFNRVLKDDRRFWLWFIKVITVRGITNRIFIAGLLVYGIWRVWLGDWTVGLLLPLVQWTTQISENLWRIGQIEHRLNWNMPSIRSMMEALTQKDDVKDAPDAARLEAGATPRVDLVDVGHAYGGKAGESAQHVLRRVSFSIAPGEKVALLGPSGAGKTTVMRLLQRYFDPENGSILVDGRDLRDVELQGWQRLVGYIPQQSQVLDGTLRYNLTYALPETERAAVTDERLWEIMRMLKVDFGARLDKGLDTIVGRRGIKLSGGEAQRVMIAAAILKDPRFLIIDEATSSLDSTTEKQVQEGLRLLLRPETSALIIAHRLSTVRHLCTKFVLLRPSAGAPEGQDQVEAVADSFEELAGVSATFRRLAGDQGLDVVPRLPAFAGPHTA